MLAWAYENHGQELEGELAAIGVDLRDCNDPNSSFTLRRLYVMFTYSIPENNSIVKSMSCLTKEELSWSNEAYILASIFDAIQGLTYTTQAINTSKNKPKPKPPKPHPRPGSKSASRPRRNDWFPGETIVTD